MNKQVESSVKTSLVVCIAVLGALILLSFSIASPRYQIAAVAQGVGVYKLDSWTGRTWFCTPRYLERTNECIEHMNTDPRPDIDFDEEDRLLEQQRTATQP